MVRKSLQLYRLTTGSGTISVWCGPLTAAPGRSIWTVPLKPAGEISPVVRLLEVISETDEEGI